MSNPDGGRAPPPGVRLWARDARQNGRTASARAASYPARARSRTSDSYPAQLFPCTRKRNYHRVLRARFFLPCPVDDSVPRGRVIAGNRSPPSPPRPLKPYPQVSFRFALFNLPRAAPRLHSCPEAARQCASIYLRPFRFRLNFLIFFLLYSIFKY